MNSKKTTFIGKTHFFNFFLESKLMKLHSVFSKKCEFRWGKGQPRSPKKRSKDQKTKILKFQIFEIAKSCARSLRVEWYIVIIDFDHCTISYCPSKKGLQRDLSKMPQAITP